MSLPAKTTFEIQNLTTEQLRAAVETVRTAQVHDITNKVERPQPLPIVWTCPYDKWGFKVEWVSLELAEKIFDKIQLN